MPGGKEGGPLSPWTIRTTFATVRHFLRWCEERGYQGSLALKQIKEPQTDPKAISQRDVDALLLACWRVGSDWVQYRNTALIYVLRDCGCRVGAVVGLEVSAVDLAANRATAPDKTGVCKMRFVDQTVDALSCWLAWRAGRNALDDKVFTGQRGSGLTRQGIERVLDRLAGEAKITVRHNPHSFRHAFARDALRSGADLSRVSRDMGHSSVAVTDKHYARWADDELQEFHTRFSPGNRLPLFQK